MSRSRSRSPISSNKSDSETKPTCSSHPQLYDDKKKKSGGNDFCIQVMNIPKNWKYTDVYNFISRADRALVKHVNYVKIRRIGECRLQLNEEGYVNEIINLINNTELEDKKLIAFLLKGKKTLPPKNMQNRNAQFPGNSKNKQNLEVFNDTKKFNTYDLSIEFLQSLGIKLPLKNKIFVANISKDVDEPHLREIFGNAGIITELLIIEKLNNDTKCAKISYDHPVEAVQAISMFNNRTLFNQTLYVTMDNRDRRYPKIYSIGMANVGPGLAMNGKPLRNVRVHLELQKIIKKVNELNQSVISNQLTTEALKELIVQKTLVQSAPPAPTALPTINMPPNINNSPSVLQVLNNSQEAQNFQLLQSLLQQNSFDNNGSSNHQAFGVFNENVQQPMFNQNQILSMNNWTTQQTDISVAPNQLPMLQSANNVMPSPSSAVDNMNFNYNKSYVPENVSRPEQSSVSRYQKFETPDWTTPGDRFDSEENKDTVVFTNLPPSVTQAALKAKMNDVGDVKFAEIRDQGMGVVCFSTSRAAKRCINLFNQSRVDGKKIEVRYF